MPNVDGEDDTMNLRELLDQLATVMLVAGGDIDVIHEDGHQLASIEYDDEEGPVVLLQFSEPGE